MEQVNNQKNEEEPEASGTSSETITSADLTARYNAIFHPSVDNSSCELSKLQDDEAECEKVPKNDEAEHTRCKKVTRNNKTKKTENSPLLT